MDSELQEAFDRQNDILRQLMAMVSAITQKRDIEQDWYDSCDAMRILKVCDRTLRRLRVNHPDLCRKIMGKWYYNITLLLMFKGE